MFRDGVYSSDLAARLEAHTDTTRTRLQRPDLISIQLGQIWIYKHTLGEMAVLDTASAMSSSSSNSEAMSGTVLLEASSKIQRFWPHGVIMIHSICEVQLPVNIEYNIFELTTSEKAPSWSKVTKMWIVERFQKKRPIAAVCKSGSEKKRRRRRRRAQRFACAHTSSEKQIW